MRKGRLINPAPSSVVRDSAVEEVVNGGQRTRGYDVRMLGTHDWRQVDLPALDR